MEAVAVAVAVASDDLTARDERGQQEPIRRCHRHERALFSLTRHFYHHCRVLRGWGGWRGSYPVIAIQCTSLVDAIL